MLRDGHNTLPLSDVSVLKGWHPGTGWPMWLTATSVPANHLHLPLTVFFTCNLIKLLLLARSINKQLIIMIVCSPWRLLQSGDFSTNILAHIVAASNQKSKVILPHLPVDYSTRVFWPQCARSIFPSIYQQAGSQRETDSVRIGHDSQIIHLPGSLHVNSTQPALCMSGLKTLGPVYTSPHCRGKEEQKKMNVSAWKGGVLKGEWTFPSVRPCLDKLHGNILVINHLWKLCSVDLLQF